MEKVTTKFSFFQGPINRVVPTDAYVTVADVANFIGGHTLALGGISYAELEKRSKAVAVDKNNKQKLPYVTFSARYAEGVTRKLTSPSTHTGLFVLDIDKIDTVEESLEVVKEWPHTMLAWISPSGNGIKCVVKADFTEDTLTRFGHAIINAHIIEEFEACVGLIADPLKDMTRACYLNASPSVYCNMEAEPLSIPEDLSKNHKVDHDGEEPMDWDPPENPFTSDEMLNVIRKGVERKLGDLPFQSRYNWLLTFVTECNKKGFERESVKRYVREHFRNSPQLADLNSEMKDEYTIDLVDKLYTAYQDEYGRHFDWMTNNYPRYQFPIPGAFLVGRITLTVSYAAQNFKEFFYREGNWYKFNGQFFEVINEKLDHDFSMLMDAVTTRDNANERKLVEESLRRSFHVPATNHGSIRYCQFRNGILDVKTGAFKTPSTSELQAMRTTWSFDFNYDPDAKSNLWDETISKILSPNKKLDSQNDFEGKIRMIYEYMGYALFGNGKQEYILNFVGSGANGKSTVINALIGMLPIEIMASLPPAKWSHEFSIGMLQNRLVNIVSDVRYNNLSSEDVMKQIVSNETIWMNRKFREPVQTKLHCAHIFASNNFLVYKDSDAAVNRRIIPVVFNQVFNEADRDYTLKKRLDRPEVYAYIFNCCYKAYLEFEKRGRFLIPDSTKMASEEMNRMSDPVEAFFSECLKYSEGSRVNFPDVYEDYRSYSSNIGAQRSDLLNKSKFYKELERFIQHHEKPDVMMITPKNKKVLMGIKIDLLDDESTASKEANEEVENLKDELGL